MRGHGAHVIESLQSWSAIRPLRLHNISIGIVRLYNGQLSSSFLDVLDLVRRGFGDRDRDKNRFRVISDNYATPDW